MFSFIYQRRFQRILWQSIFAISVLWISFYFYRSMIEALASRDILPSFYFLDLSAGFDIGEKLISFSRTDTYARAFLVGILNTLCVSFFSIVLATILGFIIGIFRLSSHLLLRTLARVVIALTRNIPLLVILVFFKSALFNQFPRLSDAWSFSDLFYISNRGISLPWFDLSGAYWLVLGISVVLAYISGRFAPKHKLRIRILVFLVCASLSLLFFPTFPIHFSSPQLSGFNLEGGLALSPEFLAVLSGLVLYHSAFIAEIVRSGIQSLPVGQKEAGLALGLSTFKTLKFVILPQAVQVIIPPMISLYLNIVKNSTLAAYVGYPDLFSVAGTVFNQTGRSVEVILILMGLYLFFSLVTSIILNIYNRRIRKGIVK
jgi:general L-amino acid transport system permease protein